MSLAVKEDVTLPGKYAAVSVQTQKACELFMSFCELEQRVLSHPQDERPQFLKWILKQEARYFNRFISLFAEDMNWADQPHSYTTKPPEMFLKFRKVAQGGKIG
jgi:hypothetical protein